MNFIDESSYLNIIKRAFDVYIFFIIAYDSITKDIPELDYISIAFYMSLMQNSPVELLYFLNSIHPLLDSLRKHLSSILKCMDFNPSDFLLTKGKIAQFVFFLENGLVRSFYDQNNKEVSSITLQTLSRIKSKMLFNIKQ